MYCSNVLRKCPILGNHIFVKYPNVCVSLYFFTTSIGYPFVVRDLLLSEGCFYLSIYLFFGVAKDNSLILDLLATAIKWFFTLSKASGLEPHNQMQFKPF